MSVLQSRSLNLQEYQSKGLMRDHNVNVQPFEIASTPEEAVSMAKRMNVDEYVIKAQILAGGRGKGHFSSGLKKGVHLTKDVEQIGDLASKMLGYRLVTKQTTSDGVLVQKLMIAEALDISKETYFAIVMDRHYNGPVIVASPAGGVDIEEVAAKSPELIYKVPIDIIEGINDQQAMELARNLTFSDAKLAEAAEQIKRLYNLFISVDASQVEINPFGETTDGRVVCFDAKINFDDSAKYRQKEIFAMEDLSESDVREVTAAKSNLNYIGLDGNIACLVNGAGLAMATMDIVKLHGGEPANFLDVGGGVTEQQVFDAFNLVSSDKSVKSILVNIFGGIVNCATIANGITKAARGMNLTLPVVARLEGTNVDEARKILLDSGLDITPASDFEDAAKKAVASIQ